MKDRFALDSASVRSTDAEGRMHVAVSPISKSNVCEYYGAELPDAEALGLEPGRLYRLYRDPDELARAAASFNNLPLLSEHVPVSADDHRPELVVGSTGTDAVFEAPYLRNSLVIWAADAIRDIERGEKRELSSAYRFRADMTPGEANGEPYDGVMRDIVGNHVALVKRGRAGPDVAVGDAAPKTPALPRFFEDHWKMKLSPRAQAARGVLTAYLAPKLAQDAKIELRPIVGDATAKNWPSIKGQIVARLKAAVAGKLAADADVDDVIQLLDRLDGDEESADPAPATSTDADPNNPVERVMTFLADKLSPEDLESLRGMMTPKAEDADPEEKKDEEKDKPAEDAEEKKDDEAMPKAAMDAAIKQAVQDAEARTMKRLRDIRIAEDAVAPFIGKLANVPDSAAAVYRLAFDAHGVDYKGVNEDGYPALLKLMRRPDERREAAAPVMDSATNKQFETLFGDNVHRLKRS